MHFSSGENFDFQVDSDLLFAARLSFSRGETTVQLDGFEGGMGLLGGEHFWSLPNARDTETLVALQGDLRGLPSGVYEYELARGIVQLMNGQFIGNLPSTTGQIVHVNSINSAFGAGWELGGIQQLLEQPDGAVLLVDGDGTNICLLYTSDAADE